ncbi:MAG: putative inorganic carbon transporter subunit DabA [Vulcanimicrobiota bacterium]
MNLRRRCDQDNLARIQAALAQATHLLPEQAPLRRFVHHNPLHHLEHLPFDQAVAEATRKLGTQGYPGLAEMHRALTQGRILPEDLEAVLDCPPEETAFGCRRRLRLARLQWPLRLPDGCALEWHLTEGQGLSRLADWIEPEAGVAFLAGSSPERALGDLWQRLCQALPSRPARLVPPANDQLAHPILIRFCAAYLDCGLAYWPMPNREEGLFAAFRALYGSHYGCPEDAVLACLEKLGVEDWSAFIEGRLLSLRGWAGMIFRLELHPELAPGPVGPVRLLDFLAIMLLLEVDTLQPVVEEARPDRLLAYEALLVAQAAGLGPAQLQDLSGFLDEVAAFGELERRRLLHLAYERRYRRTILDALASHTPKPAKAPEFQAIFCIDERCESLRRHLEENSAVETFGYPGFFGLAMAYQGLEDHHPLPLCPVSVEPTHLVREVALEPDRRRHWGSFKQVWRASRNSLLRGGLLSSLVGVGAALPLVGRVMFSRLFEKTKLSLQGRRPATRLLFEREPGAQPGEHGWWPGYTPEEMAGVVESVFKAVGLRELAPLVVVVGHGSSSLNNPHEAAHDCGACGGGRGGPNARALAMMANHPEVRRRLGFPASTWFVGAYHNTCDDALTYYDLDLCPEPFAEKVKGMQRAFGQACQLDAQERCRRFDAADVGWSPGRCLAHVQARAVDLAQPRPEYGHATNSMCIIGRRQSTRGLFLDRRAFLVSYDYHQDPDGVELEKLLQSVAPVGAGINLEYYFSYVDPNGFGCGTKLPHNIVGLLGVMDGHSSDLRTGLPWQMVEIHEPVRLLLVIEAPADLLERLLERLPALARLVDNGWLWLTSWNPDSGQMVKHTAVGVRGYEPRPRVSQATDSVAYFRGQRGPLAPASLSR